jgi:hypothetical protein
MRRVSTPEQQSVNERLGLRGSAVATSAPSGEPAPDVTTPRVRRPAALFSVTLANAALFTWLAGVLVFGRAFSEIGVAPVFLADVLAVSGVLLSLPRWWPMATGPGLRGLVLIAVSLAVLTLQSVYRGVDAGYPAALKSACMGVYPLVAIAIAGLVAQDPELIQRFGRRVLPYVAPGSMLVGLRGGSYIAAASGLYLACAAAWSVVPGNARRGMIAISTLIGAGYLMGVGARRGPTIAILLAIVGTRVAILKRLRARQDRQAHPIPLIVGCFSMVLVAAAALWLSNSSSRTEFHDLPLVGSLASRVVASTQPGTESGNNIELRWQMWRYAVDTTVEESFWFGRGAGQPIETGLGSTVTIDRKSGVHNSFIGYAFYSGFPSAALVVLAFLLAAAGSWRCRALPGRAPLFGAVLAVTATSMTNVALETPYIAGPAWAILGAAVGAAVVLPVTASSAR